MPANMKTKSFKMPVSSLLVSAKEAAVNRDIRSPSKKQEQTSNEGGHDVSPRGVLLSYVDDLVNSAAKSGSNQIGTRDGRHLDRLLTSTMKACAKDILRDAFDKYSTQEAMEKDALLESPDRASSAMAAAVVTPARKSQAVIRPLQLQEAIDLEHEDDTGDAHYAEESTTDEFLADLQEEVLLQSLLCKRMREKKELISSN